jgi:hypothetical protein
MPVKRKMKAKPRMVIVQDGAGFLDFLGKAVSGARKTKAISKVASGLSKSGIPVVSEIAELVGPIAGLLGFGKKPMKRKPRKKGSGLSPPNPGGGARKKKAKTCKKVCKKGGSLNLAGKRRRTVLR